PIVIKRQVSLLPAITLLSQVAFAVFYFLYFRVISSFTSYCNSSSMAQRNSCQRYFRSLANRLAYLKNLAKYKIN
ncbi:MAG: hypothetical protein WBM86_28985, partial [Waterburya sp.]